MGLTPKIGSPSSDTSAIQGQGQGPARPEWARSLLLNPLLEGESAVD